MEKNMKTSEIHGEFIKLNQWLKKENLIPTGGEAKFLIGQGSVRLNGQMVTELRKKLYNQDVVEVEGAGTFLIQRNDEA